jgi:Holliday junction resolvase RusA-like endonuclease
MITFTIPGKPYPQKRPRVTKFGTFMPKENREAEKLIKACLAQAFPGKRLSPTQRPLRLSLLCAFAPAASWPQWKREAAIAGEIAHTMTPDGDNLAKTVKDALNRVIWQDDSQIVTTEVRKCWDEKPYTLVNIYPVNELRHDCSKADWQNAQSP